MQGLNLRKLALAYIALAECYKTQITATMNALIFHFIVLNLDKENHVGFAMPMNTINSVLINLTLESTASYTVIFNCI